jgi:hypothetical protein
MPWDVRAVEKQKPVQDGTRRMKETLGNYKERPTIPNRTGRLPYFWHSF